MPFHYYIYLSPALRSRDGNYIYFVASPQVAPSGPRRRLLARQFASSLREESVGAGQAPVRFQHPPRQPEAAPLDLHRRRRHLCSEERELQLRAAAGRAPWRDAGRVARVGAVGRALAGRGEHGTAVGRASTPGEVPGKAHPAIEPPPAGADVLPVEGEGNSTKGLATW